MTPYPNLPQFPAPPAPTCNGRSVACAVCSCWNFGTRYGLQMPSLAELGRSMGARHRAAQPGSRHGICPGQWCSYCVYLELRARGLAVGYGPLTIAQIRGHARVRHAMAMPGAYGRLPKVSPSSYSKTVPARGRSDSYLGFHQMVVWFLDDNEDVYHVSDADFGSAARPVVPPYSEIDREDLEEFHLATGGWGICYAIEAPKPAPVKPGVRFRFGGRAFKTIVGTWAARVEVDVRKGPIERPGNVTRRLRAGDRFEVAQGTYAGDRVGRSSLWLGNAAGTNWLHRSTVRRVS